MGIDVGGFTGSLLANSFDTLAFISEKCSYTEPNAKPNYFHPELLRFKPHQFKNLQRDLDREDTSMPQAELSLSDRMLLLGFAG